jgi:hypothetical protein
MVRRMARGVKSGENGYLTGVRDVARVVVTPLTRSDIDRKRRVAQSFRSQFEASDRRGAPVLPPCVLRRLLSVGEVVFC